jgi:hypothetical protein
MTEQLKLKPARGIVILAPEDPAQLEQLKDTSGLGLKEKKIETCSLIWKCVAVGEPLLFPTSDGWKPTPVFFEVGKRYVLRVADSKLREEWHERQNFFEGQRVIYLQHWKPEEGLPSIAPLYEVRD